MWACDRERLSLPGSVSSERLPSKAQRWLCKPQGGPLQLHCTAAAAAAASCDGNVSHLVFVHVVRCPPLPWQVFWNVTLPNIRWGLMYGIILTNAVSSPRAQASVSAAVLAANSLSPGLSCGLRVEIATIALQRAMGEFGAVSVISGNIIGRTQTLTLYVEGAYKVQIHSMQHACNLEQLLSSTTSLPVEPRACSRVAYAVFNVSKAVVHLCFCPSTKHAEHRRAG